MTAARLITPTIAACLAISGGVHVVVYLLNATLPLHVVGLGGTKTQVGLLFAMSTTVSMILRPLVGGWVDRFGARRVMLPGVMVLIATLLLLPLAAAPAAYVALMAGLGCGNGVLATAAGVLVAQASPSARRGEALSVYFLATALSFAAGPPLGLALYERGGIGPCFVAALGLGGLIALLILTLRARPLESAPKHFRGGNSRHTRNLRCMHDAPSGVLTDAYPEEEYWQDLVQVTGGQTDERLARMTIRFTATCRDWMRSPGHRENILRSSFTRIGALRRRKS